MQGSDDAYPLVGQDSGWTPTINVLDSPPVTIVLSFAAVAELVMLAARVIGPYKQSIVLHSSLAFNVLGVKGC